MITIRARRDLTNGSHSGRLTASEGCRSRYLVGQNWLVRFFKCRISNSPHDALRFKKALDSEVPIFRAGSGGLLLQRHFHKDWAANFMMQLMWTTSIPGGRISIPSIFPVTSAYQFRSPRRSNRADCAFRTSWIPQVLFGILQSVGMASIMTNSPGTFAGCSVSSLSRE